LKQDKEANNYIDSREDLAPEDKQKLKNGIDNGNDGAAVEAEGDIKSLTIAVVENQVANPKKIHKDARGWTPSFLGNI
jgi:hypothetical protein